MNRYKEYPAQMIADARELYLKYNGRQTERIEREMRGRGWRFYRSLLYATKHTHGVTPGWPERFGWDKTAIAIRKRIVQRRHAGRNSFESWLKKVSPELHWTWKYQRYIYEKLAAITAGSSKRLMIFMPPRHGKSEMVTIRYTAWRLLRDAGLNVIIGSYNQRLADRFSRRIKRIVADADWSASILLANASSSGVTAPRNGKAQRKHSTKVLAAPSTSESGLSSIERLHAGGTGVGKQDACAPVGRRLNSACEWETPTGGVVRSVGVGAGIAGFGAGLIVIDDPVKNRAEAESEAFRDRVWEWFNDDIYTRMEPNASIILIQTRWHEDDLAGRLLNEMKSGGEKWDVVCLPALAEPQNANDWNAGALACNTGSSGVKVQGSENAEDKHSSRSLKASLESALELNDRDRRHAGGTGVGKQDACVPVDPLGRKEGEALCPKRYPAKTLLKYKRKLGSYSFSALYQQRPVPLEGGRFKRAWFKNIVDKAPDGLRWKRGYDLAISTKTSADYTASFRCAFDKQGNLYIADGFRARIEYPEQRRFIVERMKFEANTEHGVEAAAHGKAVVQELRRDRELWRYAFRAVYVTADKLTRALAWLNLAEEGKVILVRGAWNDEFVDEICRFPNGRHDDQIDAVSIAVNMLGRGVDCRLHRF
ncbi:MAG TPA: phage terminase large subunit [Pyrinomonadaceae bacterium]|nr:phage terminase large subunit [Acidobacteriota bacterium]HQZ97066.1 phage terminase large subunit [Pyrinomonadaceae bacterium]